MKKSIAFVIILLAVIMVCACKKTASTTTTAQSLRVPRGSDSLMETQTADYIGPPIPNVSGILVACKISGIVMDTTGSPISYNRMWEAALFESSTLAYSNAGTVSINSVPLNADAGYYYQHYDVTPSWNEGSSNHWLVSGTDIIPAIAMDITGSFPSFSDSLPTVISRTRDFSIALNSSNTVNADSGYVIIYSGVPAAGSRLIGSVVSANGGTSSISATRLSFLQNGTAAFYSRLFTGPQYYGGLIMLVLYSHTLQTIGGKRFAFVKQREYLGRVTFL